MSDSELCGDPDDDSWCCCICRRCELCMDEEEDE